MREDSADSYPASTSKSRRHRDEKGLSTPGGAGAGVGPEDRIGQLNIAAAFMGLLVVLHGLAYFLAPGWLWGVNTLFFLVASAAIAAMILALAFSVPGLADYAMRVLGAAGKTRPISLFSDKVVAVVLAGALALLVFWRLGVGDPVAAGWIFHYPHAPGGPVPPGTPLSLPVPLEALAGLLSKALDVNYPQIVRGLAVAFGVLFVCTLVLIPPRSGAKGGAGATGMTLAVSGAALVFMSARADLALEVFLTAAFLCLGVASMERRVSPYWAGLPAWLAAFTHPVGLALLPAWAFLVWRGRYASRGRDFWIALAISIAALVGGLGLIDILGPPATSTFLAEMRGLWASGSGTRAEWVLGQIGEGKALGSAFKAGGWLLERIWGTFNGLALAAPVGLALSLALVVGRGWRTLGGTGKFLAFTSVATGLLAFLAGPYAGPPRVWALYCPAGVCLTLLGVWWLMEGVVSGHRFRAAALGCVALSAFHLLPFLPYSADPTLGAETLSLQASSSSPWDVRGRAGALEEVSVFYLSQGDTLTAAETLSRAFDARPNPLYLGAAGSYYVTARRYGRAERQFERLVAAQPLDVEANLSLGILHAIRGDMERARSYLLVAYGDTSLSLPEPTIDSRSDWVDMPKGPEREALITGRIEGRYEATEIFIKGEEAARRGLLEVAERRYRAALDAYPNWGKMQYEVHLHLGTIYAMQSRFREAAYEMLLGLNSYRDYKLCTYIVNGVGYGPARPRATSSHLPPSAE